MVAKFWTLIDVNISVQQAQLEFNGCKHLYTAATAEVQWAEYKINSTLFLIKVVHIQSLFGVSVVKCKSGVIQILLHYN